MSYREEAISNVVGAMSCREEAISNVVGAVSCREEAISNDVGAILCPVTVPLCVPLANTYREGAVESRAWCISGFAGGTHSGTGQH